MSKRQEDFREMSKDLYPYCKEIYTKLKVMIYLLAIKSR